MYWRKRNDSAPRIYSIDEKNGLPGRTASGEFWCFGVYDAHEGLELKPGAHCGRILLRIQGMPGRSRFRRRGKEKYMEHYTYRLSGVCARQVDFDLEDGKVHNLSFVSGCNGNLKAYQRMQREPEGDRKTLRGSGQRAPDRAAEGQ